jgi:hypothetical protein
MSREAEDLATHVEVCAIRYQGIQEKFSVVDARLDNIDRNLQDIKVILDRRTGAYSTAMITTGGAVIVALISFLGYLIVNIR